MGIRDGDNSSFLHFGMRHNGHFEGYTGYPFAATLYQVFGPVCNLQVSFSVNGPYIAGFKPAVFTKIFPAGRFKIGINDPRAFDLNFPGSDAIPWSNDSIIKNRSYLNAGNLLSLHGPNFYFFISSKRIMLRLQPA